jgi:[ribosomal protein S5]-alanine N-acetyltransferase
MEAEEVADKLTPVLRGNRAVLRPFTDSDVAARARLGQDAEISQMFGATPSWSGVRGMTEAEARSWYDHVTTDANPHHWAIEVAGDFVGTARLHGLDDHDRRARYAVGILDGSLLGRGIGQDVTRTVLTYAFGDLALHRVDLRVLAFNDRAIACYRRCGFVEEGREREAARIGDEWHDDVIMGVLAQDFGSSG